MPSGLVTLVHRVGALCHRGEYPFRIQTFAAAIDRDLFTFAPPDGATKVYAAR